MDAIIQIVLGGLSNGSIYALIAFGFSLTYLTTQTLNFAQGDFVMIGAMLGITVAEKWNNDTGILLPTTRPQWPLWVAYILAVLVVAGMGVLVERFIMRPFSAGLSVTWIMSTVALGIIFRNLAENLWGHQVMTLQSVVSQQNGDQIEAQQIQFGGQNLYWQQIVNISVAIVLTLLLQLFFQRTRLGKSVKAVAFNEQAASLMGINVNYVKMLTFAMSGALAALAGLLFTPSGGLNGMDPSRGLDISIKAFAVAIIGGLDNILGIGVAAILFGITEQIIVNLGAVFTDLEQAILFVLLILALAFKPTGLFGRQLVQKV
jgi:branched-chain amino acid transport system permease protein